MSNSTEPARMPFDEVSRQEAEILGAAQEDALSEQDAVESLSSEHDEVSQAFGQTDQSAQGV